MSILAFVVLTLLPLLQDQPEWSGSTLQSSPSKQGFMWHHHFWITMEAGRQSQIIFGTLFLPPNTDNRKLNIDEYTGFQDCLWWNLVSKESAIYCTEKNYFFLCSWLTDDDVVSEISHCAVRLPGFEFDCATFFEGPWTSFFTLSFSFFICTMGIKTEPCQKMARG